MLFNSYIFLFGFLPPTLVLFHVLVRIGDGRDAIALLSVASLAFYAWWEPLHLPLLLLTVVANYLLGGHLRALPDGAARRRRWTLAAGIAGNLLLLALYKYSAFLVNSAADLAGLDHAMRTFVLPLGISFYTFTQIAYLVDSAQKTAEPSTFEEYLLFVSFFPHLIAGPVVYHRDIVPQFRAVGGAVDWDLVARGTMFFAIGLFKKVVIADTLAGDADRLFADPAAAAAAGAGAGALEAWTGVLAYTLQLYFDFSGYSDMAVGLALLFGIRLPYNFDSPYKAVSIIDFWRRWHITLSHFLRTYLYIPLGGSRKGPVRRHLNLMATMLLGGLWHGAAWTFVAWGALHGACLVVNHGFHALRRRLGRPPETDGPAARLAGRLATLVAVMVGWVFFRANGFDDALAVLAAMAGTNGAGTATAGLLPVLAALAVTQFMPNSQEIVDGVGSVPGRLAFLRWRPTPAWAAVTAAGLLFALTQITTVSAFLYFQF